jgi:TPR repeat protein
MNILPVKERKINILILPIIALLFVLLATPVLAGDFEDGLKFSISHDYKSAAISFRKAAEQGEVEAQYELALMYEEGRGVTQDYQQAAMWYLNAAEQDHARAQFKLGKMLFSGKGIKRDNVEAYKWFSIANDKNKRGAKMDLGEIASQMTQPQIAEAKLRKHQWLKARQIKSQPSKQMKNQPSKQNKQR